uniref:Ribosomal protein S16 n=1 Tax=Leishmania enriettii TaxID=5663 RepID=Q86LI2_LEIEN|nr:ribosomal protein S16 [Leishmania enriettii]
MPATRNYALKQVQTFGKKKTAIDRGHGHQGCPVQHQGEGVPLQQILPDTLRAKIMEAITVVGSKYYSRLRIDVTVHGGGQVSQAYAARQAIAKGLVAFFQKYHNEVEKPRLKDKFLAYDKFLLDRPTPALVSPKKWGRHSCPHAALPKSYR